MHTLKLGDLVVHGIADDAGMGVDGGCILGAWRVSVWLIGVPALHVLGR